MPTMTFDLNGFTFRWRGGSHLAGWGTERSGEHVPDLMITLPDSLNRSRATEQNLRQVAENWLGANA